MSTPRCTESSDENHAEGSGGDTPPSLVQGPGLPWFGLVWPFAPLRPVSAISFFFSFFFFFSNFFHSFRILTFLTCFV